MIEIKNIEQAEKNLPLGSTFIYLGNDCVVMRYCDYAEGLHHGTYGLIYEYADARGVIRKRMVAPRDLTSFFRAIDICS